jgi:hypothetical protein
MPTFSSELPSEKKHMGFDIVRTPTSKAIQAIITCEELLVCDTHYWGGRTLPCERKQQLPDGTLAAGSCPACNDAMPFRTHVYVSAIDTKTHEHFIFECTSHAAKPLADYHRATGTLRGCIFHSSRPKGCPNSKVIIETNTTNLARTQLPEPPNLVRALTVIWRIPQAGTKINREKSQQPRLQPQKEPLNRMRNQPDNQPDPSKINDVLAGNDGKKPAHTTT